MAIKTLNILALAGSLRSESFNRKVLRIAKQIVSEWNVNVIDLDLKTLNLPLFDADLRTNGFPESVKKLKDSIASADVILIATPEYNHSIPGVLKKKDSRDIRHIDRVIRNVKSTASLAASPCITKC
ncbi:MAG: NADPH-dependent FMN reductase [Bacteroidota bacterium]